MNIIKKGMIILIFQLVHSSCMADQTELVGDKVQLMIPAIGALATLCYEQHDAAHGNQNYEGTQQWIKAFVTTQVITESLKVITHKRRPNGGCCKSFPSGHTAASFMGASFIHQRYGWKPALPAYIAAAYVGYSRMHAKKHYGEDVFAGAVIGLGSSLAFTKPYKGVTITPVISHKMVGIAFRKEW